MALPKLPKVVEDVKARPFKKNYILFWNNLGLDLNRIVHTFAPGGPQDGPPVSARALAILHLAIHDAYFGVFPWKEHTGVVTLPDIPLYLDENRIGETEAPTSEEAKDAVAGAAIRVLRKLYTEPNKPNPIGSDPSQARQITQSLADFIDTNVNTYTDFHGLNVGSKGYQHGVKVADRILIEHEVKSTDIGAGSGDYKPKSGEAFAFDDDPSHPVRLRPDLGNKAMRPYHGPKYGTTATIMAATKDFKIAEPYIKPGYPIPLSGNDVRYNQYLESLEDVYRMGGAEGLPSTRRRPAQTAEALFWAYDGVKLIGTPPRLYNQIIRQVAFDKAKQPIDSDRNNADFARLLALANVAMSDAGVFCWREKYAYEVWRPLSGVRQHPGDSAPEGAARPFWKVLGAPATNSDEGGFKPPFPAYPSGHATFGAAAFQVVRRFYHERCTGPVISALLDTQKGDPTGQSEESTTNKASNINGAPSNPPICGNDTLGFTFVSDELNGISRELYQAYIPTVDLKDQPGDVRTRISLTFKSMKHAIYSNAISRIWLGVHWHFDAFAGYDIMHPYADGETPATGKDKFNEPKRGPGYDTNPYRPKCYKQLYQCDADGSTKYREVEEMNWFHTSTTVGKDTRYYGGVPLGMQIADNIFETGMKSEGSLLNLSPQSC
ncbi:uncharacterized protein A1O9_06265 [Exophiala aquamarina CBS 119918]|uniref:Vanadium chloroperoxidase N-terminal domain-containing protein n=1 Tax=Exophiala aquamarina CBS 119918 TaxID=1182545 RepID=A0A072PE33_9EURO|nr:uncharacterized protein A1O9_06265 [Exophiala aquamarina CBS 119918]KEF58339.1 hypothetical protein A1O9_06265 [Exophiala aquamarina CBS 119918]